MDRLERRVREMINPYSTAFSRWWCEFGRHMRLTRIIMGGRAASTRPRRPATRYSAPARSEFQKSRVHTGPR